MDNVLKWLKREAFTVISEPRETERVEIMRQLLLGAWTIEQWRHSWENCHKLSPSHCLAPIKWHGNQRRGRWKIRISNVLWIVIYQNPGDQDGPCIGHQMPGRKKMVVLLPFLDCHLHHWSSQCSHCQSVQLGPPQKGGKYFFHFQSDIFGWEESMNMEKGGRTVAFWLVAPTVSRLALMFLFLRNKLEKGTRMHQ